MNALNKKLDQLSEHHDMPKVSYRIRAELTADWSGITMQRGLCVYVFVSCTRTGGQ